MRLVPITWEGAHLHYGLTHRVTPGLHKLGVGGPCSLGVWPVPLGVWLMTEMCVRYTALKEANEMAQSN